LFKLNFAMVQPIFEKKKQFVQQSCLKNTPSNLVQKIRAVIKNNVLLCLRMRKQKGKNFENWPKMCMSSLLSFEKNFCLILGSSG